MKSFFQRSFLLALTSCSLFGLKAQKTETVYLSGTGSDQTVNWQFFCTEGRNSGKWTTIPVPSNWELQGFGKYNYGFQKDSSKGREKGLYKYEFKVPAAWKGKKVQIVFEGSMTDTEVKINGKSAGPMHQGSFYAFKYDISDLLQYGGNNVLEATVAKHSANQSVNEAERKADFWIFGGIFRPVFLEALPAQNISRVALDAKANGAFKANVYVQPGTANEVSAQIYTLAGQKVGTAFKKALKGGDSLVQVATSVAAPRLWTPETPNRYRVEFSLLKGGKPVHTVSKNFGFRTVEVKERDGVYVNGVKIKFKGVNRHSFWPETGRALSRSRSIADVQLMKDMNMNAVRMSHYPPDGHFLEVCDSLGLFVMDELAGWHGHYDTPTGTKLFHEMLEHDENHPSVVFWINGNEGGHNYELDHLFDEHDIQRRPLIHAWEDFRGFDTQHYREYNYGVGNYMHGHSIVMPTEFLHGMYDGGHGAGIEDYWEAMWHYPQSAGGFLWDFADQGVVRTDKDGFIDTDGNHGADGIVGPHHEKEGSYYTIKEVWSPVYFERRELTPSFDGTFYLENRYHFTNLNQCKFSYKLATLPLLGSRAKKDSVTGSIPAPNLKPLEKGALRMALPANWKSFDVLHLTATDPHGRELFTWSWPITLPAAVAPKIVKTEGPGKVDITTADSAFIVKAGGNEYRFHQRTGILQQLRSAKGEVPFNNGPVLQEAANNFAGFKHRYDGNNLVIESTFDRKNSYNTLQWTVYPSGWVRMKVNYFPGAYFTRILGVNFSFPQDQVKGIRYMGKGPYRVWKNRMKGNAFGVWEKAFDTVATGMTPWKVPEFTGYHANMYWAQLQTTGQPLTFVTDQEDLFLRLFTPHLEFDPWHNIDPTFPSGDISFMQGIAPIGTKTQKPETTGPMSDKHIYYDYEKDPKRYREINVYFKAGE
ncbi:glycoside hydrolase family 2 TIM barrel-domain containing protein [Paraflavisolibacter sp. H34]|uniref:glycoside hydrolase family 2 protein n=1 Tax=Huijunlia imazamoxiresistens TaxID=3127457 RepID=UPI003017B978